MQIIEHGEALLGARAWQDHEIIVIWRPQGDSNPCYRRERAMSWASRRWGPIRQLRRHAQCRNRSVVEVSGIEPLTSCMPCKRSPS